jgi:starch phosphorylase
VQQYFFVSCSSGRDPHPSPDREERRVASDQYAVSSTTPNSRCPSSCSRGRERPRLGSAWESPGDARLYEPHPPPRGLEVSSSSFPPSRHLEIVYEINRRFLNRSGAVSRRRARVARMSLIDESAGRSVRMAHLATVGATPSTASLTALRAREDGLLDSRPPPERFDKTNSVTRGVSCAAPALTSLILGLATNGCAPSTAAGARAPAGDAAFQEAWRR